MTTNARKTDAQRLGNGKKAFNVKQIEEKIENLPSAEEIEQMLESKQDVLIAGDNITIVDNVISATGGSSGGEWKIANSESVIASLYNNYQLLKDVFIKIFHKDNTVTPSITALYTFYLPKGKYLNSPTQTFMRYGSSSYPNVIIENVNLEMSSIFSNGTSGIIQRSILIINTSNNSIVQVLRDYPSPTRLYDETIPSSNEFKIQFYYKD